jgi:hypothetical protein
MWLQLDIDDSLLISALWQSAKDIKDVPVEKALPNLPGEILADGQTGLTLHFELKDLQLDKLRSVPRTINCADGTSVEVKAGNLGVVARVTGSVRGKDAQVPVGDADVTFRVVTTLQDKDWLLRGEVLKVEFVGPAQQAVGDVSGLRDQMKKELESQTIEEALPIDDLLMPLLPGRAIKNLEITARGFGDAPSRVSVIIDVDPITTPVSRAADVWDTLLNAIFKEPGKPTGGGMSVTLWYDALLGAVPGMLDRALEELESKATGLTVTLLEAPTVTWLIKSAEEFTFKGLGIQVKARGTVGDLSAEGVAQIELSFEMGPLGLIAHASANLKDFEGTDLWTDLAALIGNYLLPDGHTVEGDFPFPLERDGKPVKLSLGSNDYELFITGIDAMLFSDHYDFEPLFGGAPVVKQAPEDVGWLPLEPQPGCLTLQLTPKLKGTSNLVGAQKQGNPAEMLSRRGLSATASRRRGR